MFPEVLGPFWAHFQPVLLRITASTTRMECHRRYNERQVSPMVIRARYENGVFKPLEKVPLKEGTEADVYPRTEEGDGEKPRRSVKDFEAFGMWKDRTDFKDGLDYENRMRKYRK